ASPTSSGGGGSEGRLRSVMTSQSATISELKSAIASVEAVIEEARREMDRKQLRERRAAYEHLHTAMDKADEEQLEHAIEAAVSADVDDEVAFSPAGTSKVERQFREAGKRGDWEVVLRLHAAYTGDTGESMKVYRVAMLAAYHSSQYEEAAELYTRLRNFSGSTSVLPHGLKIFGKLRDNDMVKKIWMEIVQSGVPISKRRAATRLEAASDMGDIVGAAALLDFMSNRTVPAGTRHYNLAIRACKMSNHSRRHEAATYLLQAMIQNRLQPKVITFQDILKAQNKLLELQMMTPEEKAAKAERVKHQQQKKDAFQFVKKNDVEGLAALLDSLEEDVHWQDWRDYAGRTLVRCAADLRSELVQKELAERTKKPALLPAAQPFARQVTPQDSPPKPMAMSSGALT
ncbi:unnamed protein product, partial [Symbiodinium microadriaticum]